MKFVNARRTRALTVSVFALTGLVAATGLASATSAYAAGSKSLPSATLNGDGSTFQLPYNQGVIEGFKSKNGNITINYNGVGSGQGQQDLQTKLVQFAGSDVPIPSTSISSYAPILYFPTVAAPVTLSYNLSGVSKLTLNAAAIAGIFAGKITKWNSPIIAKLNKGVTLPSTAITPVHRSDSSGTTANFTDYLVLADPTGWTLGTSKTINWPGGQAGDGNSGVATIVKQTSGAIGYVDYSDAVASNLSFASVINKAGKAVAPTLAGASAAVAAAPVMPNLIYNPINTTGRTSYPITSPTFIIIYKTQTNNAQGQALKAFLQYILTTGQGNTYTKQADFAPLSRNLDRKAQAQLKQIVIPSS